MSLVTCSSQLVEEIVVCAEARRSFGHIDRRAPDDGLLLDGRGPRRLHRTGRLGHPADARLDRVVAQFDRLYAEGATQPRVMSISVHPYIMGVAHRIGYFEAAYDHMRKRKDVWFTTAEEIYDWFRENPILVDIDKVKKQ